MKYIFSLYFILFNLTIAHADLSVEMGLTLPDSTNLWVGVVDRIKGSQCREDEIGMYANMKSHVLNLDTGEGFTLTPDKKIAVKTVLNQSARTNAIAVDAIKDTGMTEAVNGYDAEIYTYTSSKGNYTLWIAKDFSNFAKIKQDLVKRDRLHTMTKSGILHLSTLPGMLLKFGNATTNAGGYNPQFHVFMKEEPIDDSVFDLPKDYHFANTNETVSTTNAPPTK